MLGLLPSTGPAYVHRLLASPVTTINNRENGQNHGQGGSNFAGMVLEATILHKVPPVNGDVLCDSTVTKQIP